MAASGIFDFIVRQSPKRYILNHGDLKSWHLKLFADVVPVHYYAGNYRGPSKAHPCLNTDVAVGPNRGAPASQVESEMRKFSEDLEAHIRATDEFIDRSRSPKDRLKAAVQLAAFVGGSIIKIHPFLNGNGRIARFAMNFILHRYLDKTPFFIHRPPHADYEGASEIAMREGNFIPLYQYLLTIMATS
jgi:fido (protein-threonine AMPylation protein)